MHSGFILRELTCGYLKGMAGVYWSGLGCVLLDNEGLFILGSWMVL